MKNIGLVSIIFAALVASVGVAYAVSSSGSTAGQDVYIQSSASQEQDASALDGDNAQTNINKNKANEKNKKTSNVGRYRAETMLG